MVSGATSTVGGGACGRDRSGDRSARPRNRPRNYSTRIDRSGFTRDGAETHPLGRFVALSPRFFSACTREISLPLLMHAPWEPADGEKRAPSDPEWNIPLVVNGNIPENIAITRNAAANEVLEFSYRICFNISPDPSLSLLSRSFNFSTNREPLAMANAPDRNRGCSAPVYKFPYRFERVEYGSRMKKELRSSSTHIFRVFLQRIFYFIEKFLGYDRFHFSI